MMDSEGVQLLHVEIKKMIQKRAKNVLHNLLQKVAIKG